MKVLTIVCVTDPGDVRNVISREADERINVKITRPIATAAFVEVWGV